MLVLIKERDTSIGLSNVMENLSVGDDKVSSKEYMVVYYMSL